MKLHFWKLSVDNILETQNGLYHKHKQYTIIFTMTANVKLQNSTYTFNNIKMNAQYLHNINTHYDLT